jgi:hypothetical protein
MLPPKEPPVAEVEVQSEQETDRGWSFEVVVRSGAYGGSRHTVTLSWADYNRWTPSGAEAPERVVRAVVRFVAERWQEGALAPDGCLPRRFDSATVRRWFPDLDRAMAVLE